jgi:hypothetical protein
MHAESIVETGGDLSVAIAITDAIRKRAYDTNFVALSPSLIIPP